MDEKIVNVSEWIKKIVMDTNKGFSMEYQRVEMLESNIHKDIQRLDTNFQTLSREQ